MSPLINMEKSFRWVAVATLAILAAASSAQQYVDYRAQTKLGSDVYDEQWTGDVAGDPLSHSTDQTEYGFASTFASGEFGVNRAAVRLRGTDPSNPVTYGAAYAGSSYFDRFTIDNIELDVRQVGLPPPCSSTAPVERRSTTVFSTRITSRSKQPGMQRSPCSLLG